MNLKKILMELGNRLVTERHFSPGQIRDPYADHTKTTVPITKFTIWLNEAPEAQEILAEMGIQWPVVNPK